MESLIIHSIVITHVTVHLLHSSDLTEYLIYLSQAIIDYEHPRPISAHLLQSQDLTPCLQVLTLDNVSSWCECENFVESDGFEPRSMLTLPIYSQR